MDEKTIDEYAVEIGKHRGTVQRWITAGMPARKKYDGLKPTWMIDPKKATQWRKDRQK